MEPLEARKGEASKALGKILVGGQPQAGWTLNYPGGTRTSEASFTGGNDVAKPSWPQEASHIPRGAGTHSLPSSPCVCVCVCVRGCTCTPTCVSVYLAGAGEVRAASSTFRALGGCPDSSLSLPSSLKTCYPGAWLLPAPGLCGNFPLVTIIH